MDMYLDGSVNPMILLADEYQDEVRRTYHSDLPHSMRLAAFGLGVAGEAGEVADLIKKHVGHGHGLDRDKVIKELGDVLWYVTALAEMCSVSLSQVMLENARKLRVRYPNGFTQQDSINRKDT